MADACVAAPAVDVLVELDFELLRERAAGLDDQFGRVVFLG